MNKPVYVLHNTSGTPGSFMVDGKQFVVYPGETMSVKKQPLSVTGNLVKTIYLEEQSVPRPTGQNEGAGDKNGKENK